MAITGRHVVALVNVLWARRKSQQSAPEGEYVGGGRFAPSAREACGIRMGYGAAVACCTLEHCAVLVQLALAGCDVPADVRAVVGSVRMATLTRLVA